MRRPTWRPPLVAIALAAMVQDPAHATAAPARIAPALHFEANAGQLDPAVRFAARAPNGDLLLADDEAVYTVRGRDGARGTATLRLVGARAGVRPEAERPLASRSHYLVGADPKRWHRDVPHSARVVYREPWAGIDLVFRGDPQRVEYDLVVAPGADPARIALRWSAAGGTRLDAASGEVHVETAAGTVRQRAPHIFQERDGEQAVVEGRFAMGADGTLRVVLGDYDRTLALVIDPVIEYGTYLGGALAEAAYDVAVDASGHAYVVGGTASPAFPTEDPLQPLPAGNVDAFVTKLAPDGATLVWSTYFGGTQREAPLGIAIDPLGQATIVGSTASVDLPVANAAQPVAPLVPNAFVTKLAADGGSLVFSTYLGGAGSDSAWSVGADANGRVAVTGETSSTDFPIASAAQPTKAGGFDAFLTVFAASGAIEYSTYWGGNAAEIARSASMSAGGDAFVVGQTQSCDYPVVAAHQASCGGAADGFAVRFDPSGAVVHSTYLGGAADDYAFAGAVDAHGSAYVTGRTFSADFPTHAPLQPESGGIDDAFVVKLDPAGAPLYATYFGGSGPENRTLIEQVFRNGGVDGAADGSAAFAGVTASDDLPLAHAFQATRAGGDDAFVAKLTPDGQRLVWSSYLGGAGRDAARGVGRDAAGHAYVAGDTESLDLPTTPGAFQPESAGGVEAFVVRIDGPPQCSNGVDDDGDGHIDFPADPGCASPTSLLEAPACDDGVEDDGDGDVDLADAGCRSRSDGSEGVDCADGLDNDGDGRVDLDDPGCKDASGAREDPTCDDDRDNDGDGRIDWDGGLAGAVPDPNCTAGWKQEKPAGCGLGVELLAALVVLARRGRRSPCQRPWGA